MGYYSDIYVILKSRSKKLGLDFMNHFLPMREEQAGTYEFPRFGSKTEFELKNAEDLMTYMEEHSDAHHCIYWRNKNETNLNRYGMLFYTPDGYMIFGISRDTSEAENNTKSEEECLKLMTDYLKTKEGYITYECPPEDTYQEFKDKINSLDLEL